MSGGVFHEVNSVRRVGPAGGRTGSGGASGPASGGTTAATGGTAGATGPAATGGQTTVGGGGSGPTLHTAESVAEAILSLIESGEEEILLTQNWG